MTCEAAFDHAPAVYWFWHSIPTIDEIHKQLHEMYASGIRTFYIQARTAMPLPDYLSEAYFSAYRAAMLEAKSLGMIAGIYDDYNWDSGQAGGRTVSLNDAAREQHLFWTQGTMVETGSTLEISGIHSLMFDEMGEGIKNWVYENGQADWGDWLIVKALGFPDKNKVRFDREVVDLTEFARIEKKGPVGCSIRVDFPDGKNISGYRVVVFAAARCLTSRLINYLSQEAVDSYIEADYEPYKAALSEFFGNPIQSVFFDHPYGGFYDWQERFGELGNSLMFEKRLESVFEKSRSYPLEKALLSFLYPMGDETPKLRTDFFETYGTLGRSTFFGTLAKWTGDNGLALTGHELLAHVGAWGYKEGFTFLDARTNFGADYFAIDHFRDRTAVDASNYHAQISAKIGDSVAKANGRRGCSIEQYAVANHAEVPGGAGKWELSLDELHSQAIRHTLFGASQFIFHAFYQTDGNADDLTLYKNPRFDFAPGINFEPWFTKYPRFSGELKALSDSIQSAQTTPCVAILYPLRTWWAEDADHLFSQESGRWFQFLLENNIQFDVINEEQIEMAEIKDSCLKLGRETYPVLIFPGVSTIKSSRILRQVSHFVASGGLFLASGDLPAASQKVGRDPQLQAEFKNLFKNKANTRFFETFPTSEELGALLKSTSLTLIRLEGSLDQPLWSWQGERNGEAFVIAFNDNLVDQRISIQINDPEILPYLINWEDGSERPWLWFDRSNSTTTVYYDADARALLGFVLKKQKEVTSHVFGCDGHVHNVQVDRRGIIKVSLAVGNSTPIALRTVGEGWSTFCESSLVEVRKQNVSEKVWNIQVPSTDIPDDIYLSDWKLTIPGLFIDKPVDVQRGWELQGADTFAGEGIYTTSFALQTLPAGIKAFLELPRVECTAEVWLNGSLIGEAGWPSYRWELPANLLNEEENKLSVKVRNSAANYYYNGTPYQPGGKTPSGLLGAPEIKFEYWLDISCKRDVVR